MPRTNSARPALVFAKAPRPGLAKTRLIPLLGPDGAAALHARLIKHTLSTVSRAGLRPLELHATPADDDFLGYCAARYSAELVPQTEGDLGARMLAALSRALACSTCAILVGTDCPALRADDIGQAVRKLERGLDAVFAPTEDGGYALIGLTRCDPELFRSIAWGTASVMSDTRRRLRALNWRWGELDTTWDVDTPADYRRLLETHLLEIARSSANADSTSTS
jgi:uncharacterized protein